jgi:HD-GYP domain-containing protein (c-di-GMP phosphodiesterase class II)
MSGNAGRPVRHSIHRVLVFWLVLAAVCTSTILTTLVVHVMLRNMNEHVGERAAFAIERLRWSLMEDLDSPGLGDHARVQGLIEKAASGRIPSSDGHFVLMRILGPDFREVARVADTSYAQMREAGGLAIKGPDRASLLRQGRWSRFTRVGGAAVLHMASELKNSANKRAGFVEGVYAISPAFVTRTRLSAAATAGIAVTIVLLTTVILYPAINRLLRRVAGLSANLLHANLEVLSVLGSAIAKRDNDTDIHNYRVTIYSIRIAEEMGLDEDEIRTLIKGAFLHDVGKIGVRDAILLKPSDLSQEEFEEMKQHVRHGLDIVSRSEWLRDAALVVGNHHEKYDGTGYLTRIKSGEIPLVARIFAIADVFDALTSKRPYKEAFGLDKALEILGKGRGTHFDPEILDVFTGIAPSLYQSFANRDDDKPRADLMTLGARYFDRTLIDRFITLS